MLDIEGGFMNEQDRKLLELAAKAAGVEVVFVGEVAEILDPIGGTSGDWSPLDDDGDALRLAIHLRIHIEYIGEYIECWGSNQGRVLAIEKIGCKFSSTRRAIVRAAAEIGRNAA